MVPVSVTDRCAAERSGDLSTVELLKQSSKQDVTADVYTLTVNGLGKFAMRVLQTRPTAYRPYRDLQIDLLQSNLNSGVTYEFAWTCLVLQIPRDHSVNQQVNSCCQ